MDVSEALAFARTQRQVILAALRADGRPHLSNVMAHVGEDDVLRISITNTRAKYRFLVDRPWAAVHVQSEDHWAWAVLEGPATLGEVVQAPDDAAADELVALYRDLAGEHQDWEEYRASLVTEGRVCLRITPDHAYGQLPPG